MLTLIFPAHSNPVSAKRTIDNVRSAFGGLANEFIVGDVSIHENDFLAGASDVRVIPLPFNFIFKNGFANTLNTLASHATNDLVLYLNCSEIVECNLDVSLLSPEWNCWSFNHAEDPHTWVRCYDRRELQWSGRIHEEIIGPRRLCPRHLFRMADTEKSDDGFRAACSNDVKEITYFQQYVHIVEHPEDLGATNEHWLNYSRSEYDDLKRRLNEKGERYQAFVNGDLQAYLAAAHRDQPGKEWSKP